MTDITVTTDRPRFDEPMVRNGMPTMAGYCDLIFVFLADLGYDVDMVLVDRNHADTITAYDSEDHDVSWTHRELATAYPSPEATLDLIDSRVKQEGWTRND